VHEEGKNFLNKTHSADLIELLHACRGSKYDIFGKPLTDANKKLISKLSSKSIYLYDANKKLISKLFRKASIYRMLIL